MFHSMKKLPKQAVMMPAAKCITCIWYNVMIPLDFRTEHGISRPFHEKETRTTAAPCWYMVHCCYTAVYGIRIHMYTCATCYIYVYHVRRT